MEHCRHRLVCLSKRCQKCERSHQFRDGDGIGRQKSAWHCHLFNFSQSLQALSSAIEGATLPLQVDGYNVWIKSLASCTDKSCNDTQTLATSDKPPVWSVPTTTQVSNDGGPVTGDVLVTRKPAKRNGCVSISPLDVGMYGNTALATMLMNKLSF